MRRFTHLLLVGFLLISIMPGLAHSEPSQFRGSSGQGHYEANGLPTSWSETENVAWKTSIPGKGWSSTVVSGQQVWMTTALEEGKSLRAICVDLKSGELLHNIEVFTPEKPVGVNTKNSHASPTPVIEKGRVYVHFGTMGTACLSTIDGEVLWKNESLKLVHKEGPGSSPISFGDLLIINCDGKDVQYVAALEKETGKVVWTTKRSAPFRENPETHKAYSTPLVVEANGSYQIISPGADQVNSYDPVTGKELWQVRYIGFSNVPRPIFGHGFVYICTGYFKPSLLAIRVDGAGNVSDTHVAWNYQGQVPTEPSPILVDDKIYMIHDRGVASCVDAKSGKKIWQHRMGGNYSASPISVDGHIYFFAEDGKTTIIHPGDKYQEVSVNQLNERQMASPIVIDGALLIRTEKHLYRIEKTR